MSETPLKNRLQLAVVVLNYRTPKMVIECLQSLDWQIDAEKHRVIVVDNQSGDDSVEIIANAIREQCWEHWVQIVESPVNGGFAAGNNVGIQSVYAENYMLLNSDTIVRSGAVESVLRILDEHPEIDMLAPRLEWPDETPQISTFRYRTPLTEFLYASKIGLFGRVFPKHVVARSLQHAEQDLDWASFACMTIRSRVIDRIGLLDEKYFMYFEDMAYCRMAKKAGFNIGFDPKPRVVHLRGGSSPVKEQSKQRKRRPHYYYAARSHYFRSQFGFLGWIVANVLWTLGWGLGALRGRSGAVQREFIDIWSSSKHTMNVGKGAAA